MESPAEMIILTIDLLLIIFINPNRPFHFPKAVQLTLNDFENCRKLIFKISQKTKTKWSDKLVVWALLCPA